MQLNDALATYRLTRLVQEDQFPPVVKLKEMIEGSVPENFSEYSDELLHNCPWCLSFWIALAVIALRRTVPRIWDPLSTVLAMSAVTGIMNERFS